MPGRSDDSPNLLGKAKGIILIMLAVFALSFGAGYAAGKLKIADIAKIRASKLADLSRNLETKVPVYGPLLQKYKTWERERLFGALAKTKIVKTMFTIFFNNWIMGNLTMSVRSAFLAPMLLYPVGKFIQGLTFAQTRVTYQTWGMFLGEFGGYFLVICGTLCVVLWTLFYRKFRFSSRGAAFFDGLKVFFVLYLASGFILLFSSYVETMSLVEMTIR